MSNPAAPKFLTSIWWNSSGLCVWMSGNLCSGRRLDRLSISGDLCQEVIRAQLFLHDKPWQALTQWLQHATEEGRPSDNAPLGGRENRAARAGWSGLSAFIMRSFVREGAGGILA